MSFLNLIKKYFSPAQNERHQELILEMAEFKKYGGASVGPESLSDAERPSDNLEIDEIMAKLEQVQFYNNDKMGHYRSVL